jgi:hypothetical protein
MSIELKGDFIAVQKLMIKISEIISIKPQSIVSIDTRGNILARDFPKIIIQTKKDYHELLYTDDKERDSELLQINETIAKHQAQRLNNDANPNTTINISGSSSVNVVSNSSNVTITQDSKNAAYEIIEKIKEELDKIKDINQEVKVDILDSVSDIKTKIESKSNVPRFSFKSLLGLTSDLSSVSSLVISLGQILGYIPK